MTDFFACLTDALRSICGRKPYPTVQAMLEDTALTYANCGAGEIIEAGGFRYEVAENGNLIGSGGVPFKVLDDLGFVCPEQFNAKASPHDATSALKAMHAFCEKKGVRYVYKKAAFKISEPLHIKSSGDMSSATIEVDAEAIPYSILIGAREPSNETYRLTVHLPEVVNTAKTAIGWSGFEDSIGVELANLYECRVFANRVHGFGVGIRCSGYSTGFVFNEIYLSELDTNKVQLSLRPGDDAGWVNDNIIVNGWYYYSSSEGENIAGARSIELAESSENAVHGAPNNNVFRKSCIEGNAPEYHIFNQGSYNSFNSLRWESSPPKVHHYARTPNDAVANMYSDGYSPEGIVFSNSGNGGKLNGIRSPRRTALKGSGETLVLSNQNSSGNTGRHITGYSADFDVLESAADDRNWSYLVYSQGIEGKRPEDKCSRVKLDFTKGRAYFGFGDVEPHKFFGDFGSALAVSTSFYPVSGGAQDLGGDGLSWQRVYADEIRLGQLIWRSGEGSPEGFLAAPKGSMFSRTDENGPAFYVKESGEGATGWVAK